jgi:hypothetical protein
MVPLLAKRLYQIEFIRDRADANLRRVRTVKPGVEMDTLATMAWLWPALAALTALASPLAYREKR